jgi:hypothetical protein
MIKAKLRSILQTKEVLIKISQAPLPFKLSYNFSLLYRIIVDESEKYEVKRLKLVNKYKTGEENGNAVMDDESKKKFSTEINKILDSMIELQIEPINVSQVPDVVSLSIADMYILEKFITLP